MEQENDGAQERWRTRSRTSGQLAGSSGGNGGAGSPGSHGGAPSMALPRYSAQPPARGEIAAERSFIQPQLKTAALRQLTWLESSSCSTNYNVQQNMRIVENHCNIRWCVLPNVQQFVSGKTDGRYITKDRTN